MTGKPESYNLFFTINVQQTLHLTFGYSNMLLQEMHCCFLLNVPVHNIRLTNIILWCV